jgi:hypothetical protein
MAIKGWLQKVTTTLAAGQPVKPRHLPATQRQGNLPAQPLPPRPVAPATLPNATIIYGIGAAILFVASFFLLIHAHWLPAFMVFVLGMCLVGFALHLLKHQD